MPLEFPETRDELLDAVRTFIAVINDHGTIQEPDVLFVPPAYRDLVMSWGRTELPNGYCMPRAEDTEIEILGMDVVWDAPCFMMAWLDPYAPRFDVPHTRRSRKEWAQLAYVLQEYYGMDVPGVVFGPPGAL